MLLDCKTCGFGPLKNGKCRFAGECPNKEEVKDLVSGHIPSTDVELAVAESVKPVETPKLACVPSSLCVNCAQRWYWLRIPSWPVHRSPGSVPLILSGL